MRRQRTVDAREAEWAVWQKNGWAPADVSLADATAEQLMRPASDLIPWTMDDA